MTTYERAGLVFLALLVFLGGWFSPAVVASRHRVADRLLEARPGAATVTLTTQSPRG